MRKGSFVTVLILFLFSILFSGCLEENVSNVSNKGKMIINSFNVFPSIISKGDTANISWDVSGAMSVEINMGVGSVGNLGSRVIYPNKNTTYVLTASNLTHSINASVYIVVNDQELDDENDSNTSPYDLIISGENNGYIETEYLFNIIAFGYDENDLIKYHVDWGDGESFSSEYMQSGFSYQISHEWTNEGIFVISVYTEGESGAVTNTKIHKINIVENKTEDEDNYIPTLTLNKSEGFSYDQSIIKIDSISEDDIFWDDVEISLTNISSGSMMIINYVPLLTPRDQYMSVGDVIMLYDLTENDVYKLNLTYIPISSLMGFISWTQ